MTFVCIHLSSRLHLVSAFIQSDMHTLPRSASCPTHVIKLFVSCFHLSSSPILSDFFSGVFTRHFLDSNFWQSLFCVPVRRVPVCWPDPSLTRHVAAQPELPLWPSSANMADTGAVRVRVFSLNCWWVLMILLVIVFSSLIAYVSAKKHCPCVSFSSSRGIRFLSKHCPQRYAMIGDLLCKEEHDIVLLQEVVKAHIYSLR